jgi:hypothetical protein
MPELRSHQHDGLLAERNGRLRVVNLSEAAVMGVLVAELRRWNSLLEIEQVGSIVYVTDPHVEKKFMVSVKEVTLNGLDFAGESKIIPVDGEDTFDFFGREGMTG